MPFDIPPSVGLTVDEVFAIQRRLANRPRCRRCPSPVEVYDFEHWSSQCAFHNDEDDAMRREYREDEARCRSDSDDL